MADQRRRCPECHRQFRPRRGTRRVYCEACRPPKRADGVEDGLPIGPPVEVVPPVRVSELEAAVRAELTEAGRLDSWRGQVAVRLAREADAAKGSSVSSLLKQLEVAMKSAMDGVPVEPDFVDEMAERRRGAVGSA